MILSTIHKNKINSLKHTAPASLSNLVKYMEIRKSFGHNLGCLLKTLHKIPSKKFLELKGIFSSSVSLQFKVSLFHITIIST